MCWEKLSDEFERAEIRLTETATEEELERPETWREPVEEPKDTRERERVLEHV